MEFTKDQEKAIDEIVKWYKTKSKPYFTVSGRAGVGKTTIVPYLIEQLKLNMSELAICAFTGKAALRLVEQGLQACTIHHLLYKPNFDKQYYALRSKGFIPRMKWTKVKELNYSLVVIDEWSMVSTKIFNDLMSYNVPILFLGDSNQLSPVGGEHLNLVPDVEMNQIMRQNENSPIIQLASSILDGVPIEEKDWGNDVKVISRNKFDNHQLVQKMKEDYQVLVQTNNTRRYFNQLYRQAMQFNSYYPTDKEKLICLQNYWNIEYSLKGMQFSLVNGLIGQVSINQDYLYQIMDEDDFPLTERNFYFECDFLPNGASEPIRIPICKYPFNQSVNVEYLNDDDGSDLPLTCSFDFAYALTTHKFQGSESDNVLVYREWDKTKEWLYTSVTRAKDKLIVVI